jgi:glutamyl-tRNA synthetase
MPQFAHLPLLLKPNGEGKLSKRDADQMGFPIFPMDWIDPATKEKARGFRESGYLPEAVVNFLALLGWNPGTTQELFTMDELIQQFSIERIGKAGTKFDILKAQWFNQQYLRAKPDGVLADYLLASLKEEHIVCSRDKAIKIVSVMKERATFPADFWEQGRFLFFAPTEFDDNIVSKKWNDDAVRVLTAYREAIGSIPVITAAEAKTTLESVTATLGIATGKILQALRLAITGVGAGLDLMMIMEIIGKDEVVTRITFALENLRQRVA